MNKIATVIHRSSRRVWIPCDQLRAIGFADIDVGDVEAANARARAPYQAAGHGLRRRRETQAAA